MESEMSKPALSKDILKLDAAQEVERITFNLRSLMKNTIKRRGIVLGLSGGIDSSVTCALVVKAFGPQKVFGLHMPERHSADETLSLSTIISDHFGIESAHENISGILEAVGFYQRYDAAVKSVIPDYGDGWKSKIVTPSVVDNQEYSLFSVVVQSPQGETEKVRLPLKAYLEILAATNFKQRTRKMLEYYYADRLNYAVAGTPNRLEYDQGFFVKLGDGAADVKPIAHLYKTQVYQLAEYLGIPEDIRKRPPTTDTYSMPQGQDEFFFSLPYDRMDLCLYGKNHGYSVESVAAVMEMLPEQVQRVYEDIEKKRNTTRYLHLPPQLVGEVPEIEK
jgi:NAD+ synthase